MNNTQEIESLPNGARFYRCALQVNTFDYLKRHAHPTSFTKEDDYNAAIVQACLDHRVEVVAITDHYRIASAAALSAALRSAGVIVFPGFEAVSKDGVHFLCLFDPETPASAVQARIGACGIHNDERPSPLGELSASQLLAYCPRWEMQCIAAHVASEGGLLRSLAGQARIAIWQHEELSACSIPGPIKDALEDVRAILENKNADYKRNRAVAVLNCQDVKTPDDLKLRGTCCFVKMTTPTAEGLRQAFLDPGSRIRLLSDPEPEEHVEFVGIAWETEGFLRGCKIHFNENLNVIIGGRGSGKSTIIESIRYVLGLEPITEDAKQIHDGIIKGVLRSGTKISLLVRSYRPDRRQFIIERTVPNPPRVVDQDGNVLTVGPLDIVKGIAVFGQNELAELARSPERLTALLNRFVPDDKLSAGRYKELGSALETSRRDILECRTKLERTKEQLASLPGLEETMQRYRAAGVEEKLKDRDAIIRAESIVRTARDRVAPFKTHAEEGKANLPMNVQFLKDDALKDLPIADKLKELKPVLTALENAANEAQGMLAKAVTTAESGIQTVADALAAEKTARQSAYEQALRDLQKAKIDGDDFIRLRQEIERLKPLREELTKQEARMAALQQQRRNELAAWEDAKRERFQQLERAGRKVSKELPDRLRVTVSNGANRMPLSDLLKRKMTGRSSEAIAALVKRPDLSLPGLSEACQKGTEALASGFGIPTAQAARMIEAGPELPMLIEELDLPHVTEIELNIGPERAPAVWRKLGELSTGQKATALLYLLLMESEAPLVLDQPEDNLDNRFISEGIVPKIRSEKRRRQFIFATHNANIPVLGDAELIVGMRAVGEAGEGVAEVAPEALGSIDKKSVAVLAEEILEGGKDAFVTRHRKYGF